MKVVILAGGFGSRISEESHLKPKPMIEIGQRPILWHIMKLYSHYGFNDFIICLGYMGFYIKEYFSNYYLSESDVTFNFRDKEQKVIFHNQEAENWSVTLVNTGANTMTGGRLKRIKPYVNNEPFMVTYGDGVADIDISALLKFHKSHGKIVTVTAVQNTDRFGVIKFGKGDLVEGFSEKPKDTWINGGFFVMEPEFFNYLEGDDTILERKPLQNLSKECQLMAYRHKSFWHCMDTIRDKNSLEKLWKTGKAPWMIW